MAYTQDTNGADLEAKSTPISADVMVTFDSADSNRAKKTTFTQLQAWIEGLSSYFNASTAVLNDVSDVTITSPANGEALVYNSSSGEWENQTNTTPDADETTAGVVEEATTAEIDADTASGSLAKLFITPAKLVLSKYGLQLPSSDEKDALAGSSGTPSTSNTYITEDDVADDATSGKIVRATGTALPALSAENLTDVPFNNLLSKDLSGVDIRSTTSETDILSFTVPADTLSTGNGVKMRIRIEDANFAVSSSTFIVRLKYGSTTLGTITVNGHISSGIEDSSGWIEAVLFGNGTTSSQFGAISMDLSKGNSAINVSDGLTRHFDAEGTATEDSTSALTLTITGQPSSSSSSLGITSKYGVAELLNA